MAAGATLVDFGATEPGPRPQTGRAGGTTGEGTRAILALAPWQFGQRAIFCFRTLVLQRVHSHAKLGMFAAASTGGDLLCTRSPATSTIVLVGIASPTPGLALSLATIGSIAT